ncbi:MAG: glycine cleavage system protein T [Zetaproteobacteria bacterium]|nr:MAG: glycine cleavage system protein T [Zetaproteobacteria bacterium]
MSRSTALHAAHVSLSAKMGAFAGYDMPLYYGLGVKKEHEWVRENAGLFDVSHMGQIILEGEGVAEFLERITPSAFKAKKNGRAQYSVLTNEQGGIVDDLIITRLEENKFFIVLNAGCKEKDMDWIKSHMPDSIKMISLADRALIALQGQKAESVLKEVLGVDASDMPYMFIMPDVDIDGVDAYICRLGYTGEDGFELSVPNDKAEAIWNKLLEHDAVEPIGLAARDSLRLEMGYCLYGHDIDDKTTPLEADLGWVMGKSNEGFIGADVILPQKSGTSRKRVGIRLTGKGIAREDAEIRNEQDEVIGVLSSGGFSPTLNVAIGQGYVPIDYAQVGTRVFINVRGRNIEAEIANMPFMPAKTKSMKVNVS